MGDMKAEANVKHMELRAVVIRANGTQEDLGTVAYYHKNVLKRLGWRLFKRAGKP